MFLILRKAIFLETKPDLHFAVLISLASRNLKCLSHFFYILTFKLVFLGYFSHATDVFYSKMVRTNYSNNLFFALIC